MKSKLIQLKRNFVFLLLGTALFTSCSNKKEPECGDPKGYYIQITIVDTNGNFIIGNGKKYTPDSVYFIIDSNKWTISFENGSLIWMYGSKDKFNNSNYLLHFAYNVVDTINMNVLRQPGNCFDNFSMQKFEYNRTIITPQTGSQFDYTYQFIKK